MSAAGTFARSHLFRERVAGGEIAAGSYSLARVSRIGIAALVLAAPFEALQPLLRMPGQSLTSVEAVLVTVLAACGWAALRRGRPSVPGWREWLPWLALVVVAVLSAALAPAFNANAFHMAARLALVACVWTVCVTASDSPDAIRQIVIAAVASGAIASLLVVADFAGLRAVSALLAPFRAGVTVVGAQVRASGPFQYPTIASMFLEITFALGLGLLVSETDRSWRTRVALIVVLALMAEAIVLTFTRAGLITMALSLLLVGGVQWRRTGTARSTLAIVGLATIVAIELFSSRSLEMLQLRLTTEGQGRWFSALIEAPETLTLDTRATISVPLTITNTGRATWDSSASEPVRLSYHWIAADSDDVIAWDGLRTPFARPVVAGQRVAMLAQVDGPGHPGRFRLMWDIEQEHRLWFSTEPDALVAFTTVDVVGPVISNALRHGPARIPKMAVRPGRFVLWSAAWRMFLERPLLGVGPDNYRLLYGKYSGLASADPRVHSNDMYIEVLAGMGLAGLPVCAWLGLRMLRATVVAAGTTGCGPGIAAACAAIAVHGLVDAFLAFTATYVLIAMTLGLAAACERNGAGHAHRL